MIKVDELREFRPGVRYKDGDGITLQSIRTAQCRQKEQRLRPTNLVKPL